MSPAERTAVVCDTTAYLPDELIAARGIERISLYVSLGGEQRPELEIGDYAGFFERLRASDEGATTSQPSVGDFLSVYTPLLEAGREELRMWFAIDTLEYLRRGGRIGAARAWLGSALQIKPILTLEEEITPVERVRTRRRVFERLVKYAEELKEAGRDAWVVQHIQDPENAQRLVERCREVMGTDPLFVSEIGPVIGAHTGPGLLGVGGLPSKYLR